RGEWPIRNLGTLFSLPEDVGIDLLRHRLTAMVRREESLRTTDLSHGEGQATYAAEVEPPLSRHAVGSLAELETFGAEMFRRRMAKPGRPWWELAVIDHPGPAGKPARSVCAVFDHLIFDARSTQLVHDELTGQDGAAAGRQGRPWREWVTAQRQQFPADAVAQPAAAGEFWRRHLDGTAPDRATILPFWTPGPQSGAIQVLHQDLPVSFGMLRTAAGRLKSSPFLLFLAGLSAAVNTIGGVTDATYRVVTLGRQARFLDTLGLFSDTVPVRVRHPELGDLSHALAAATTAWLDALEFQTTPWDYILAVCSGSNTPSIAQPEPQIMINWRPWIFEPWLVQGRNPEPDSYRYRGQLGTFQLSVSVTERGPCRLECQFDPGRFAADGVDSLLDELGARLRDLTESI
ncbi:MAG: hypothetical protein ACRD0P_21455, partial [Stackebrandtia sp.]